MYKHSDRLNVVVRMSDGAFIPKDGRNPDYIDYLAWVDAGNTPEPYDQLSDVPQEVTMRQARLALHNAGKLASVDVMINSLPDPPKTAARIEWEYSNVVQRHNGFVSQIAPLLGMTEEDIDNLFIEASKL